MKAAIISLILLTSCFAQNWKIVSLNVYGDTAITVKYRSEYMTDSGFVKRTKVEKWKCRNLRCTDTTYKKIRDIPWSEVEE